MILKETTLTDIQKLIQANEVDKVDKAVKSMATGGSLLTRDAYEAAVQYLRSKNRMHN